MRERSESAGHVLGFILSGATTSEAEAGVLREAENEIHEGMLVGIKAWRGKTLLIARVESLRVESDLFKPGSTWENLRPYASTANLSEVAHSYLVAHLTILGVGGRRGLPAPSKPPYPGDEVVWLEPDPRLVFGVNEEEPGIVWFGKLYGYETLEAPLDVENITMHIGVFGETGSGKSYGVGYLIEKLSSIPVGDGLRAALPVILVDANADYIDYHEAFVKGGRVGEYSSVIRVVFPHSSLRGSPFTLELRISLDSFTPREIAEIIVNYKAGGVNINELQVSALDRVLSELMDEGYTATELLTREINVVYDRLDALSRGRDAPIHHQTAKAVRAALDKFHREVYLNTGVLADKPTLTSEFIDRITGSEPSLVILDFSADGAPGVPLQLKQLVVAYLARLLYQRFTEYKMRGEERYLVFGIEEAQNYAPNLRNYPIGFSIARDYLALIATQGRKFGLSLLLITQRPAFLDPVILSMTNTWIIHRVSPEDLAYVVKGLGGLPRELERMLTRLPRGVAVVAGQMLVTGHPLLVKIGRRRVPHRMGATRVTEKLRELASRRRAVRPAGGGAAED